MVALGSRYVAVDVRLLPEGFLEEAQRGMSAVLIVVCLTGAAVCSMGAGYLLDRNDGGLRLICAFIVGAVGMFFAAILLAKGVM
jgi:hypothetical protein